MVAISWPGNGWAPWALAALTSLLLLARGLRLEAALFPSALGLVSLAQRLLKAVVDRPRPDDALVRVFTDHPTESFPSGHVVFFVVYLGFLACLARERIKSRIFSRVVVAVLLLGALLVGASRIWLGAHWPSDVLGGFLLGGIGLGILARTHDKMRSRA